MIDKKTIDRIQRKINKRRKDREKRKGNSICLSPVRAKADSDYISYTMEGRHHTTKRLRWNNEKRRAKNYL